MMNNAIWKKILLFVLIPFLIVFITLSVFIILTIFQNSARQAEQDFRNLGRLNELNLQRTLENLSFTVRIASKELQGINYTQADARQQGENILISNFANPLIYNAWFIFEPDAFDGRDSEFPDDYPGAPSGRYMRSYIQDRETGEIISVPDMDEALLDDESESYYYLYTKRTQQIYFDIASDYDYLWDYGVGEKVPATGISAPIFRNGEFIGAVGFDVVLNEFLLGKDIVPGSLPLVFSSNGRMWFGGETKDSGKTVREMGFENWEEIMNALERREELIMPYNVTPIQEIKTYSFFAPMELGNLNETIFLYVEIPQEKILSGAYKLVVSIAAALIIALLLFALLIFYIIRFISRPIHELTVDMDIISRGDLAREITVDRDRSDEIGMMSRSLHRMVEQFRVHITLQERSRELLDLHIRIQKAMYSNTDNKDAFDSILPLICNTFNVYLSSLVYISGKKAVVMSAYTPVQEGDPSAEKRINTVFTWHDQVESLLNGRKYILLNSYGIEELKIAFTNTSTTFLCIIPFFSAEVLRGYIILEGKNATGPFIHEDTALSFISDTISYVLTQKERYETSVYH